MKRLLLDLATPLAIDAPPGARVLTAGVRLTGFRAATVRERPPARIESKWIRPAITIGRP